MPREHRLTLVGMCRTTPSSCRCDVHKQALSLQSCAITKLLLSYCAAADCGVRHPWAVRVSAILCGVKGQGAADGSEGAERGASPQDYRWPILSKHGVCWMPVHILSLNAVSRSDRLFPILFVHVWADIWQQGVLKGACLLLGQAPQLAQDSADVETYADICRYFSELCEFANLVAGAKAGAGQRRLWALHQGPHHLAGAEGRGAGVHLLPDEALRPHQPLHRCGVLIAFGLWRCQLQ